MKPLTPKQRREIYLKAALQVFELKDACCVALFDCSPMTDSMSCSQIQSVFPEFQLFNPNTSRIFWFDCDQEGDNERILCMLFCAEMTKTAKQ